MKSTAQSHNGWAQIYFLSGPLGHHLQFYLITLGILDHYLWGFSRAKFRNSYDLNTSCWCNSEVAICWCRPKQKNTATHVPQQQPGEELALKRWPYHVPLGTPVTNKLPWMWAENEEAMCQMRGEVKLLPCMKLKKPWLSEQVLAFSNTLDALLLKKHIQELSLENHHWRLPCHYIQVLENSE